MELTEAEKYWKRWVMKPEQEKYRGKELKIDEMWQFAEDYHKSELNKLSLTLVSKEELEKQKNEAYFEGVEQAQGSKDGALANER